MAGTWERGETEMTPPSTPAASAANEPVKKRRLFISSLGKALKKHSIAKSKSRSLTDLHRNLIVNGQQQHSDVIACARPLSFVGSQGSSDVTDFTVGADGEVVCLSSSYDPAGSFDSNSVCSHERDDTESLDAHQSVDLPSGTTAGAVWKSGICTFFSVEGEITEGKNLIARDRSGTSDPYVKIKIRGKRVCKTQTIFRTLNPVWNEKFQVAVDDVNTSLVLMVYDFDRIGHDDDMGEASVELACLEVNKVHELVLPLINKQGFEEDLGKLYIKLSIVPKTPTETVEIAQLLNPKQKHTKQGSRSQIWDSILSVILVGAKKLKPMDANGLADPFVRFRLGTEKYKSKIAKETLNPEWGENFDLKMYTSGGSPGLLEISLWDKDPGRDELIGRASVDLSQLKPECSQYFEIGLEDQPGYVCLHLCITAMCQSGVPSDLATFVEDPGLANKRLEEFCVRNTFKDLKKVGWLQVKLHRAVGLAVADIGGASDPFAVIDLCNQRVITPTVYKSLNPQWDKVYEFVVYDIHDMLDITIYDEDKHGAPEFLGKVQIPLLSIVPREKRLYQLKDKRLEHAAKGHLIMTLDVVFNPVRASIRTFNPREARVLEEPPRFRRAILQRNVERLSDMVRAIATTLQFVQSLFTWENRLRSAFAFLMYILLVLHFDWFMLPLIFFLMLLKNYFSVMAWNSRSTPEESDSGSVEEEDEDEDDAEDKNKKGKSRNLREKIEAVNNIITLVQNYLDMVASLGERIKNTFNWSVPFLSYLLMTILLIGTVVLYLVPLRYILLAWGINKFTKKIRKPNAISNNEALDFLSRVPSDPQVRQRRLLRTDQALR